MSDLLRDLVRHKGHANAAFLTAVYASEAAAADPGILDLLRHVLVANRFWTCAIRRLPFVVERELPAGLAGLALVNAFRTTQEQEIAWIDSATSADLDAVLEHPLIPGGRCTVAEAFVQVCMHSHGHRAQLAKLLRGHGAVPPPSDFVLWLPARPAPVWPA